MVLRLGGLGLLFIVGVFLLRDAPPLYLLAAAFGYVVVAATLLLRSNGQIVPVGECDFPPFPPSRWTRFSKIVLSIGLISFASAMVFRANPFAPVGVSVFFICGGVIVLLAAYASIRFGYVPSAITYRGSRTTGVSRLTNPLQFWLTVALFSFMGGGLMFFGLIVIASVFEG